MKVLYYNDFLRNMEPIPQGARHLEVLGELFDVTTIQAMRGPFGPQGDEKITDYFISGRRKNINHEIYCSPENETVHITLEKAKYSRCSKEEFEEYKEKANLINAIILKAVVSDFRDSFRWV